jgi:NAD-dependent deacetylase
MASKSIRPAGEQLSRIKDILKKGKVACLTGAGISCESGIPAFRGKGGLWEKYEPDLYGNLPGLSSVFRNDPGELVDFIGDFYDVLLRSKPNPAHLCLSYLEKNLILSAVITQNIDNLHQKAGSRSVVELHGNAFRVRCQGCGYSLTLESGRITEMLALLKKARESRSRVLRVLSRYCPRCGKCGERFRIDIVFFGEPLPGEAFERAQQLLNGCRTLLIVGTSLVVYPAASLPLYAKERGVKIIEINQEPSALSDISDYRIMGKAAEILPEIVKMMEEGE